MDTVLLALRVLLSLAAVLGLLWLLQKRLSRRTGVRAGASLAVVGRQSLGRRASAVVVEVDGTRLLLGVTDQSVTVLHSLGEQPEPPAPAERAEPDTRGLPRTTAEAEAPADFARSLSTALDGRPHPGAAAPQTPDLVPMRRPRQRSGGRLGNSILAPDTWRQAGAALRQRR